MAKLPYNIRLCLAVLLTSFFAGLSGILMHELLNVVEWLAYGKSMENFLTLVTHTTPIRPLLAIFLKGICTLLFRLPLSERVGLSEKKRHHVSLGR